MTAFDLVVVGAGPAGSAAALGALHHSPDLRVALVDRADFPRDKACGDGIAAQVLDRLAEVGVSGLLDDQVPVSRLRLVRGPSEVDRTTARASYVVPRRVLDARLVTAACAAGAQLLRHRVREVTRDRDTLVVDGILTAPVVVAADGARSVLRRALGQPQGRTAFALRGYAPVAAGRAGAQVIAFGTARQPAYAWSFDRGDGLANVGYGELVDDDPALSRAELLRRLEELLPGATRGGMDWRGHHLPLSGPRWRPPPGRVLLVGDAAGLINPLTGEGIYYAVATGIEAGRAAARAIARGKPETAGGDYVRAARRHLLPHLRHTAAAARLSASGPVLAAGLAASTQDQRVFDDLVELGLARGQITPRVVRGLAGQLLRRHHHPTGPPSSPASSPSSRVEPAARER